MKITQISVFLENRRGRLYEVCSLLGKNNINIRALTIAETEEFGILKVVVDKPDEAVRILKEKNFVANLSDIVAVEVADRPGGLASILKTIADHNVNVEYMYGLVGKAPDKAHLVFRFDNTDKAIEVLQQNNIKVLAKEEINNL